MRTGRSLVLLLVLFAPAGRTAVLIEPDSAKTLPLASGGTIEFELAVTAGSGYDVEIVEQGIDVAATVREDTRAWRGFDGDLLRVGHHRIAVAQAGDEPPRLTVAAVRPGSPDGHVRVALVVPRTDDAAQAARFALDLLETDVAQRYYDPKLAQEAETPARARQLVVGRRAQGQPLDLGRAYLLLDQALMRQFRYDDAIAALREALPVFRELGDRSAEASALNDIGMHYWRKGEGRKAVAPLKQALATAQAADDALLRALVKSNICNLELSRGAIATTVECTRVALAWSEATGDLARIAQSWNNLGGAYSLTGQPRLAISAYAKSVELRERSGVRPGPSSALANLGLEFQALGRFDDAEQQLLRAEAVSRADGDDRQLAIVLRHRGQLRTLLGNYAEAGPLLDEALALQRKVGQRDDLLKTLARIGDVQRLRDGTDSVPPALREALELAEMDGNPTLLVEALVRVAQVHIDGRRPGDAEPLLRRAEQYAAGLSEESAQGTVQLMQARAALLEERYDEAERLARAAWTRLHRSGVVVRAAEASGVVGDSLSRRARYREAVPLYVRGAVEIARARGAISNPELRARFFATQRGLHEAHVSALAEIALASGKADDVLEALALSDGYRAQVLSELRAAHDSRADAPAGANREVTELREREASLSTARWRLVESGAPAATRAAVEQALTETSERLARRDARGDGATVAVSRATIARAVSQLPRDLTVVELLSTPRQGYAWIASGGALRLERMPGDAELAAPVERARRALLSQDAGTDWSTPLAELCDVAWSPWAGGVTTTRVALVPDAALQGVPWAALRCPDASGARSALVERYELVQLPALRSLLRSGPAAAAPAGAALAVVDPVYDRSDRRLGAAAEPGSTVAASDALVLRGRNLVRLGATHDEAVLLERLLGQANVTVLDGFEANRAAVLDGLSRPARLVHFGTHGVVSGDDLAGSGLVLSLLDREAHAREGFLSARELARLYVPADLVVMAACESGHGAAVVGEGLQSLAYGFLAAGARTVVGASWPVADVPTSRLMAEFYRALLEQQASPAAALRTAQRTLSRDPYWRHPRFWAGFTVNAATPSDP